MSITRVSKVIPEELLLKVVVRRSEHPLLHAFIRENVGPPRTNFIRDALEDVLSGALAKQVAPQQAVAASPATPTPEPTPPVAPPVTPAPVASPEPAYISAPVEQSPIAASEESDKERIARILAGNAGLT